MKGGILGYLIIVGGNPLECPDLVADPNENFVVTRKDREINSDNFLWLDPGQGFGANREVAPPLNLSAMGIGISNNMAISDSLTSAPG